MLKNLSSLLHLVFVLSLIGKSCAVIHKVSNVPVKIVGSDDEVLHPLFEKEDETSEFLANPSRIDAPASKPATISSHNQFRNSKNNKKSRKMKPLPYDDNPFLKMNLDLPSIISNSASAPAPLKPTHHIHQNAPSSGSSIKHGHGSRISTVKENEIIRNIGSPLGNEIVAEDINTDLFRTNLTNSVTPGTVISSRSSSSVAPGTVIATSSSTVTPGTVIVDSTKLNASKQQDDKPNIPTGFDSSSCEGENMVPVNTNDQIVNDKNPFIYLPPRMKKVRSLDEYSIEGLGFDPMVPGPKIGLDTEITVDFITKTLIPFFKSGKVLDRKSSFSILYRAYQEFLDEETLQDIHLEEGQNIIIFGDIHGQFPDFIKVIEKEGLPSEKLKYIFNGDIVDRGAYSVECLLTLLAFKIADPKNFYVSLGNHETQSVGRLQFYKEAIKKYGNDEFFKLSHALFKSFPAAYLIQNEVFVTHGGVSPFVTLDRIREIDRIEPDFDDEDIINDLIWSDPVNTNGTTSSHRGLGFLFGPDITHEFIDKNNISVIIRSHQFKELGFSEQHDGLCITIFSCPNYKGKMKNYGAYIKLDDQLNLNYSIFKAAEPNAKTDYPAIPSDLKYSRNVRRIRH